MKWYWWLLIIVSAIIVIYLFSRWYNTYYRNQLQSNTQNLSKQGGTACTQVCPAGYSCCNEWTKNPHCPGVTGTGTCIQNRTFSDFSVNRLLSKFTPHKTPGLT